MTETEKLADVIVAAVKAGNAPIEKRMAELEARDKDQTARIAQLEHETGAREKP